MGFESGNKFSTETGIDVDYLAVTSVSIDFDAKTCAVVVGLWKNKAARQQGRTSIERRQFVISGDDFDASLKKHGKHLKNAHAAGYFLILEELATLYPSATLAKA